MTRPCLIALDWGTSNLRASLLAAGARVVDRRAGAAGVMAVPAGDFEAALRTLCGDWIDAYRVPLVASGMIGSRQGWREAPYLECPATLSAAADRLTSIDLAGGASLHIVPGLCCTGSDGQWDVMRGEETQLWGAALPDGACAVLPGTHSKWAWMGEGGAVHHFQTHMTGELFAVLRQHSILGRLMQGDGEASDEAFAEGVGLGLAHPGRLLHSLFAARTAGLGGRLAATALPDFLSGILIGSEVAGACATRRPQAVTLIGGATLCRRYAAALAIAGVPSQVAAGDPTTQGQWRLAVAAGLVEDR